MLRNREGVVNASGDFELVDTAARTRLLQAMSDRLAERSLPRLLALAASTVSAAANEAAARQQECILQLQADELEMDCEQLLDTKTRRTLMWQSEIEHLAGKLKRALVTASNVIRKDKVDFEQRVQVLLGMSEMALPFLAPAMRDEVVVAVGRATHGTPITPSWSPIPSPHESPEGLVRSPSLPFTAPQSEAFRKSLASVSEISLTGLSPSRQGSNSWSSWWLPPLDEDSDAEGEERKTSWGFSTLLGLGGVPNAKSSTGLLTKPMSDSEGERGDGARQAAPFGALSALPLASLSTATISSPRDEQNDFRLDGFDCEQSRNLDDASQRVCESKSPVPEAAEQAESSCQRTTPLVSGTLPMRSASWTGPLPSKGHTASPVGNEDIVGDLTPPCVYVRPTSS